MSYVWLVVEIVVAVAVAMTLLKLLRLLLKGDADFSLLRKSLVPDFYKDKVVWVTGASSGIGEALCQQLSPLGAKIILSARSEDKLHAVKESLAFPDNSRVLVVDMSDRTMTTAAVKEANTLFGRIDMLFNNAGVSMNSLFMEMEEEVGRRILEVDFTNTVLLTKLVLTGMLQRGAGHIVNTSSMFGKVSVPFVTYYCAAKLALNGLMDSLRFELADKGIHITNVCPGAIKTNVDYNSFTGSGSQHNQRNDRIANGMRPSRCAELMLIAASNHMEEVWISKKPALWLLYLAQYFPSTCFFLVSRRRK